MLNSVEAIVQIKKKLQNPQDWIQGKSWGFYFFGIRRCLHTVIENEIKEMSVIERRKVYDTLFRTLPKPFLTVQAFNDCSQTTHEDIINYLDEVKEKLSFKM